MRLLASKYAAAYWARKCVVFIAAALLVALAITQWAHSTRFAPRAVATDSTVTVDLLGNGGQFQFAPLW
jgi:hypothetical protein